MNEQKVTAQERRLYPITARDTVFTVLAFVACFAFAALGLWGGFSLGYTVCALFTNAVFTAYLLPRGHKVSAYGVICEVLAVLLAVNFTVTTNPSVRFLSFAVGILLAAVWFDSIANDRKETGDLGLVKTLWNSTVGTAFPKMPTVLKSLLSGENGQRGGFLKAFLGVLCAVPFLCIIIPLLANGDAAFSGLISRIFDSFYDFLAQIIFALIITPVAVSYGMGLKKDEPEERAPGRERYVDRAFVIAFLSVISVCYLAYLFSQLAYFFSAFSGILPDGYEFVVSEYARRGFFEMCVIAAINIVLIFTALIVSKKTDGLCDIATRMLCLFLGLVTLTIAATALSKMVLYIKSFGMTELRITTSAFVVFLAVVIIATVIRCFVPRVPVLRIALVTAGAVLAVLGLLNVNRVIADYNYNAYVDGTLDGIDVETLSELGDEGVPYILKLCDDENKDAAYAARFKLYNAVCTRYGTDEAGKITGRSYDSFREYSIPRGQAYSLLDEFIEEHGITSCDDYTVFHDRAGW